KYTQQSLSYFPANFLEKPRIMDAHEIGEGKNTLTEVIPENEDAAVNMKDFIKHLIEADSYREIKQKFAPEIITGLARINGKSVGIIANQPRMKGGVLLPDSADKSAKFIQLCDAFNIPLLFLSDVPGFMIGTK